MKLTTLISCEGKKPISTKTIPVVIFIVCILAFGLLIPFLGFFQDDWHPVFYGFRRGLESLWELFLFDNRPYASIIFITGFKLLGYRPVYWHTLSLILRSFTVIFVWLSLCELWPTHKRVATWAALLFAVYPFFKLQPLALIYSIHWTGFLLYAFSIWAMLRAFRKQGHFLVYTLLSLLTSILHMMIIEYFIGIELIRPVVLWLLVSEEITQFRQKIKKVLLGWMPYLAVNIAYIIFRLFLLPRPPSGYERNAPRLLFALIQEPRSTFFLLVESVLKDLAIILGAILNNLINPDLIELTQPVNLIAILIAVATCILLYIYLNRLDFSEDRNDGWIHQAILLGIILTLLGPIPGWVTTQFISSKNPLWSDRFGMAAMIGASLFVVGLLEVLVTKRTYRTLLLSLLIGLSISWHLINTNEFRWSWKKQSNFYQQLLWRAPYILPNTAILSDGEIFPKMGEYPTSFALNTLYPKTENSKELNYWFFGLYRRFNEKREDLIRGYELRDSQYSSRFSSNSLDSLLIYYFPENNQCLWIIRPEFRDVSFLPEITRNLATISNLDRISNVSPEKGSYPYQIIGEDSNKTWCFFYQKAELARQFENWDEVISLFEQASKQGFQAGNGLEYLPFIEAFAYQNEFETAETLTYEANQITRQMRPVLCSLWKQIANKNPLSNTGVEITARIFKELECP